MADEKKPGTGPTTLERIAAEPTPPTTPEEARAILDAHREAKAKACWDEVSAVLKRHDCALAARPYIDDDGAVKAGPFIHPL